MLKVKVRLRRTDRRPQVSHIKDVPRVLRSVDRVWTRRRDGEPAGLPELEVEMSGTSRAALDKWVIAGGGTIQGW